MADIKDPGKDMLLRDLRTFRKRPGHPTAARLDDLFDLTEALGDGVAERAFDVLTRLYEQHGTDPETDIGAYFYLAGWRVGLDSIDQRRSHYRTTYYRDVSTSWRRSERGMKQLAALIRDYSEFFRPWSVVSVFQTGTNFQCFLDFNMGLESWRPPVVHLNGDQLDDLEFHIHVADDSNPERNGPGTRYTSRVILPETPLNLEAERDQPLGSIRVNWAMPVWPVWQTLGWTSDAHIYVRMRTFRQRAVEVSLEAASPGSGR